MMKLVVPNFTGHSRLVLDSFLASLVVSDLFGTCGGAFLANGSHGIYRFLVRLKMGGMKQQTVSEMRDKELVRQQHSVRNHHPCDISYGEATDGPTADRRRGVCVVLSFVVPMSSLETALPVTSGYSCLGVM